MLLSSRCWHKLLKFNSRISSAVVIKRFIKVNVSELRKGDWIELEDSKRVIVHNLVSSHSGRGSRSFLLTVKDPTNDSITAIKPMGRDNYERLELRDIACKFLYSNEGLISLLDEKTFDELTIPNSSVKDSILGLLEDGMSLKLRMAQDTPIGLVLPRITRCTVAEILEYIEGADKKACVVKLQGGAKLTCSVNLQPGDVINVDTDENTYQGRVKS